VALGSGTMLLGLSGGLILFDSFGKWNTAIANLRANSMKNKRLLLFSGEEG
jgi:hypothetical protein